MDKSTETTAIGGHFAGHTADVRDAWEANAAFWDERMGEGNDFVNVLCWPVLERLLGQVDGKRVLDVACGNGLTSRRLGRLGAQVTAFDISGNLIDLARGRTTPADGAIDYRVLDAGDADGLAGLGEGTFDAALSNMALFDMAELDALFAGLAQLLKPGGAFVFSLMHPCFNNMHTIHMAEREDRDGEMITTYSMKVTAYMTPSVKPGLAMSDQPRPHPYFHRSLTLLLGAGFAAGFVVDALEERSFPPDHPPGRDGLRWGPEFSEIPPVMILRMRLL